jgi:hypothetical protein
MSGVIHSRLSSQPARLNPSPDLLTSPGEAGAGQPGLAEPLSVGPVKSELMDMMGKRQNYGLAGDKFQTKGALHEHVRQMVMLERLCTRFHLVAGQLRSRHGNRETIHVEDEFDVQDLLHALLTLEHDDIQPEEWTPSYAGGNPRVDFLLKVEQVVIEAKKTRSGLGARELGEQLMIDIQKYKQHPDCRTLVCFVYDPEGRIDNPRGIENDLSGDEDGLTVRVIIAPHGL